MDNKTFREDEFPYQTLEQFGLTQEMVEDLPMAVLDDLRNGRRSPVLPIRVTDDDGDTIRCRSRLAFCRQEDDSVDVLFFPQLLRCNLDQYSQEEHDALLSGKAIVSTSPDDGTTKCFVQIDHETNQVIYVPTPVIGRNLRTLMDNFRLSSSEIVVIQDGDPLSFMEGDEMVTAGIDLREKTGIRICTGDAQKWKDAQAERLDRYSFGIFGCWVQADNGELSYIHESDYTQEIWDEQSKVIARNSSMKR